MPDWLLFLVTFTGFVFLFLQGKGIARLVDGLRARLDSLERELQERAAAADAASAPQLSEAETGLDRVNARMEALEEGIRGLGASISEVAVATQPRGDEDSVLASPVAIARTFLMEDGFSRIRVIGEDLVDGAIRFRVTARRGEEIRQGYVTVAEGAVTDASMEVPTTLFP